MEAKRKYGILGAGAVRASLIGKLRARDIGPVCATSYRLASRIANSLRAGYPVRSANELNAAQAVLVHAPAESVVPLAELLDRGAIDWKGKALVFCECFAGPEIRKRFAEKGASTAVVREFGVPARLIVDGAEGAARVAHQIARQLHLKAVTIARGSADAFDAAITLGGAALTPLIDQAAALLREAGIRDSEAARMAASIFEQTAGNYAHSGKQSWEWYLREPEIQRLLAQIEKQPILRELVLFGVRTFGKHRDIEARLEKRLGQG